LRKKTGSRSPLTTVAFVAGLAGILGCLDQIEPTTIDAPISIATVAASTSVQQTQTGFAFSTGVRVRNFGVRTIYVDQVYRRTEKLVDQQWQLVSETASPFPGNRAVGPSQVTLLNYTVAFRKDGQIPLLAHPRGLYRVGLRIFYGANGTEPLSAEPLYSDPFVVVD
jgi:hypothetical protein